MNHATKTAQPCSQRHNAVETTQWKQRMRGLTVDLGVSMNMAWVSGGRHSVWYRHYTGPMLAALQIEMKNMIQQYTHFGVLSSPYDIDLWHRGGYIIFYETKDIP